MPRCAYSLFAAAAASSFCRFLYAVAVIDASFHTLFAT